MSACDCARDCASGPWASIGINLASSGIFFCLCLLGTVLVWRLGLSWPWKRAEKKALVEDLEAANLELANNVAQRRRDSLGREVVMLAEEKKGLLARIALAEMKNSVLQKELDEAKAMGFVTASGLGAAGPSTLRKRNPS